jgi:ADP-heptose:LPS heptosyltransferase
VLIAPWRPVLGETRHVAQIFVDSLKMPGLQGGEVVSAPIQLDLKLREEGAKWLIERGWNGRDPLIALHPGAGSPTKRWPLDRFSDLAQSLMRQSDLKLMIIEGPAEPGLGSKITHALPPTRAILADMASLSLLAAVLAQSDVFIGNDSGLAHLAAALQIPSIVLFGPTRPQHWAPLGPRVIAMQNISGCEGCASDTQEHACLENITVEEVIRVLSENIRSRIP